MIHMTPTQLLEIRQRVQAKPPGPFAASTDRADLLAEVDRLRAGTSRPAPRCQRIPGDGGYEVACRDHGQYLRALLREGGTHAPTSTKESTDE